MIRPRTSKVQWKLSGQCGLLHSRGDQLART